MFYIFSKNKKALPLIFTILFFIILLLAKESIGMHYYEKLDFVTGMVTATVLNVRAGVGTNYKVVSQVHKNEFVRVFAKVGNWYVIQTDNDYIGAASSDYIKPIYPKTELSAEQNLDKSGKTNADNGLTLDENETFNLINEQRIAAGLPALIIDDEVQNVARTKAQDMVNGGYFSHTSPTYGSPFEMLKNYGISYKTAGENIAGNSSNGGAVNAWMNSEGHKANILNSSYNYTGIAVVTSPKYGKIFVQIFIGR